MLRALELWEVCTVLDVLVSSAQQEMLLQLHTCYNVGEENINEK